MNTQDTKPQYKKMLNHSIYLVRHGEVNIDPSICYGQLNCNLTASFDSDLHRLSEYFKDSLFGHAALNKQELNDGQVLHNNAHELTRPVSILSSPLTRCLSLAQGLQENLNRHLQQTTSGFNSQAPSQPTNHSAINLAVKDDFQEINFGDWEGVTWSDIGQDEIEAWSDNLLDYVFPAGESARQFHQRVINQWQLLNEQLADADQSQTVIIICHAGVIRSLLSYFLQVPLAHALTLQIDKMSVSTINLMPNQSSLSRCTGMNQKI